MKHELQKVKERAQSDMKVIRKRRLNELKKNRDLDAKTQLRSKAFDFWKSPDED
jgi:hypothetical protein